MVLAGREDFLRHALERQELTNPCSEQLANMIAAYIARTTDVYQSQREGAVKSEQTIAERVTNIPPSLTQTETVAYAQEQTETFIADSLRTNKEVMHFLKEKTLEERRDLYRAIWIAVSDRSKNIRAKTPSESMLFQSIERMLEEALAE